MPTDDIVGEMAAALSESTRYLVDKAESFNRSEAMRLERLVSCLIVANVVLLLALCVVGWIARAELTAVYDSQNATVQHASEALVQSKMAERQFEDFKAKQVEFNKTVTDILEMKQ